MRSSIIVTFFFFFQAEDGIRDLLVTGVQTCALPILLSACPSIRGVQMRTNSESGIPNDRQVEFYREWVFRAIRDAGRRVTLEMRGWAMRPGMMAAAVESGAPLRLSSKYWAED